MKLKYDQIYEKKLEIPSYEIETSIPMPIDTEPKLWKKFLHGCSSMIYGSMEYKRFVKNKKQDEGFPCCIKCGESITVELHHHPLRLEDYVYSTLQYLQDKDIAFSSLMIADIVLRMHYKNIIGYTFLCKTHHDKFHETNNVLIPESEIRGDFDLIMEDEIMKNYLSNQAKARLVEYAPEFAEKFDIYVEEEEDDY